MKRPKTKILVDGGDPQETLHVKELLGFVDGQTTNPSLIAKNPHIRQLIAAGHKLSSKEEMDEYKRIVQAISPLVGDAGVSIEVFADQTTTAKEMLDQGRQMYAWIPKCIQKVPMHIGRAPCRRNVRQGGYACQYDLMLLATTSSGGVRCDERRERARVGPSTVIGLPASCAYCQSDRF
jgi:transaldolase